MATTNEPLDATAPFIGMSLSIAQLFEHHNEMLKDNKCEIDLP